MVVTSTAERMNAATGRGHSDAVVHVRSRRFGTFDVPSERILHFPQGLIGFPSCRRYVILEHRQGSPFKWMLSIDNPELGFAVANPYELVGDYCPPIELAARLLATDPTEVALFAVVTIPPDPTRMTVNLMAPVAVDLRTNTARQIVLEDSRFPSSYMLLSQQPAAPSQI
jgi:flagellar assembly factor FliW